MQLSLLGCSGGVGGHGSRGLGGAPLQVYFTAMVQCLQLNWHHIPYLEHPVQNHRMGVCYHKLCQRGFLDQQLLGMDFEHWGMRAHV